jgi:hypothetical protein
MCLEVGSSDLEVIQVVVSEREADQNSVHDLLKTAAHIAKTKWHSSKLKEPKGVMTGLFFLSSSLIGIFQQPF